MNFTEEKNYITVTDFSVSKEEFNLLLDDEYQILKTHPQPKKEDLSKYYESEDYISHTDSKRNFIEKLYHLVKNKAIKDKVSLINEFTSTRDALLDIGCGTGDFLVEAKSQGWQIKGYEPNIKARTIAANKEVVLIDAIEQLADNSFDIITLWHVLEHIPDVEKQIQEIKRMLKPDGVVLVAVPNYKSFDAKQYKNYWAAYDVPRHLWHFSKTSIKKLFTNQEMELVAIKPMLFDSFYVSLLSEKYKNGKGSIVKAFIIGLCSNIYGVFKKEYSSHIYILKNKQVRY